MNYPTSFSALDRRAFLKAAGAVAGAVLAPSALCGAQEVVSVSAPSSSPNRFQIGILEKVFFDGSGRLKYSPDELAQTLDEIGLDLEMTVRKDGHITPENTPDELPRYVEALAKKNRRILWIALDTVKPNEPHWEKAIRTARQLGIPQYRHRGFRYAPGKPLKAQLADFHNMARDFAAVNKEIGIQALYQTHMGKQMAGGAGWDLDILLGDINPQQFGVAFDTQHMMVEEGLSWPNVVELLAPRTATICVKSFRWEGDQPQGVPLGQGRVKKEIVDQLLAAHGGPLPLCIHIEYFRNSTGKFAAIPFADRAGIVNAFRADARVLKGWLGMPTT